jgi:putative DNA primase/helicase
MRVNFDALIAAGLHTEHRFVGARVELRDGRRTKVPYCAFKPMQRASSTDPATWSDFETAREAIEQDKLPLLGFVLGEGFVGVDLDKCRNPKTGVIEAWASAIVERLDSYTEISVSGTGVHVICRGELPTGGRRKDRIEMYDAARYFVMTGQAL